MIKKIGNFLVKHIKENVGVYFLVTLMFTLGISIGAFTVKALNLEQKQELVTYLNNFFQILNNQPVDRNAILIQSVKGNIQTAFFIWFLGITIIGVPLTLLITSFRGFIVGFTISFFIQGLGFRGLLVYFAAILPQNIIYIPCILVMAAVSLCFSSQLFKVKIKKKIPGIVRNNIFSYSFIIITITSVMLFGSIIEAYISPSIMKGMSSYINLK